jgi:hypothetical protein
LIDGYFEKSPRKQNRKGEEEDSYTPTKQGVGPGQTTLESAIRRESPSIVYEFSVHQILAE